MKNDIVSVRPNFGRTKLLLPGLAVYASPENLKKLQETLADSKGKVDFAFSSPHSELVDTYFKFQLINY